MTAIYRARDDDPTELARLAADGWLRRLIGDVYVPVGTVVDLPVRAAVLAVLLPLAPSGGGAVAALEAAGWLYTGGPPPGDLDVYVPTHRSRRRFRELRVHEDRVDDRDVETVGRVRVTSPARTAADLCRSRPVEVALLQLERLRTATGLAPRAVQSVLDRMARQRGVPHGRDTVQIWAARLAARTRLATDDQPW